MTLLAPIAIQTVLIAAGVLAGLTIIAYILKMRRRRFEVPFSTLWHRVLQEKESTSLWKHFRRLLSLLLQLFMLALLLFAALDPYLGKPDQDARNVVIIVDASASMKSVDEGPDGDRARMVVAKEKVRELLQGMGGSDAAMIMRMDGQTTPLTRFDSDMPMLRRVVDSIQASDTPADLRRALSAAADALHERNNPLIVLVGDGAYPEEVLSSVVWKQEDSQAAPEAGRERLDIIDLSGIDVRYIPVGKRGDNVGIISFNARRYLTDKTTYSVFIEVQNFGAAEEARKLVVYSGESAVDVKTITLKPRERVREIYPNLSGGEGNQLRAELQPVDSSAKADIFALDDRAYALLPTRKKQKVLLVTSDNLYLEGAMLVYDSIQVDKLTPEQYESELAAGRVSDYNAVVFDNYTPANLPPPATHLIYFHPTGEHTPIPIQGTIERPRVTEVNETHPVMRWVVMSDVNFDASAHFAVDSGRGEVSLARYVRDTIIAARRDGQRKIVAFGFELSGTDLTLRVAFPLLLVNALDWFAGDDADLITTYSTGRRFRVPLDGLYGVSEVDVRTPSGTTVRAPVVEGHATFYGNWIGVHRLIAKDSGQIVAAIELAANLANPSESDIEPASELALGGSTLREPEGFVITHRRSLWVYLALCVALILCMEWVTYNRRITV